MKLQKTPIALAAITLLGAAPLGAQTSTVTMQAEHMSLSSYVVENGNRIKLSRTSGTATRGFTGASGTYDIKVNIITENDGRPTLELHRGSTRLHTYTYPQTSGVTSGNYTVRNVALKNGEAIKLVGHANGDAWARVDSIQFVPVTSSTTSSTTSATTSSTTTTTGSTTIEAESMSRSSYTVENSNRIKLTASSGSAWKSFSGESGTYNVKVDIITENDGRPTLELHRGSTRLHTYTYPQTSGVTSGSYTVNNVALKNGETIKLVGRANGDAWARVDRIVLTKVSSATSPDSGASTSPDTATPTPSADTSTSACANPSGGYEGFGKNTTGGAGKPIYRVKNRNNSGAGSLRDAVSQGNRCVVFDVGGTIALSSNVLVRGANLTIDGLTAPSPGITLKGGTLVMQGSSGAGNIVLRGIRHRSAPSGADAIRVYNASNIVIDRVSVSGYGDGGIDVTEKARNVTIQWSILGAGATSNNANLIAYGANRVTVHKNLYIASNDRHPYCGISDSAKSLSSELVCDVRNNLIWDFKVGTTLQDYGKANVVNNYYYSTRAYSNRHGIWNDGTAKAYIAGNYSKNGWHINGTTQSTAYSADVPKHTDALTAAQQVMAGAGARGPKFGLDSVDKSYLGQISLQ